jgi:hypothetical protein
VSEDYRIGTVVKDASGEIFFRVNDPDYPWRFLDPEAGTAEPRTARFPQEPLEKLGHTGAL